MAATVDGDAPVVRGAPHAGKWYEKDGTKLSEELSGRHDRQPDCLPLRGQLNVHADTGYVQAAPEVEDASEVVAAIGPHAGF